MSLLVLYILFYCIPFMALDKQWGGGRMGTERE